MKQFTILKVGYTSGIYGCSGEYFNCIIVDKKGLYSIPFNGMYGTDHRVAKALKEEGYEEKYISTDYGKMTRKDMLHMFLSEDEAIKKVQEYSKMSKF